MKSLTGSFRPGLESITWNSFLIEKFIDDGKYVLDVFQAKLTDTRKFSSSMEKLIRDISQSSLIQEGDFGFENIKCVNIQVFIDILESCKRNACQISTTWANFVKLGNGC